VLLRLLDAFHRCEVAFAFFILRCLDIYRQRTAARYVPPRFNYPAGAPVAAQ